ncbi:MAG: hypothetical protein ACRET6_02115, partial [Burkholderiales bacterium]
DTDVVIECRLRGGSMEPTIPRGAALRISLGRAAPYRVGQIVAFVEGSGICVHRVACLGHGPRARDYLVTQGDACLNPDVPISARQVIGPVTEFRRNEEWVPAGNQAFSGRARSLAGRMLLLLVAGLMEINVNLARGTARILRLRKEQAMAEKA